jgi:hemerythrin HHE cation binding domain-containing protein
VKRHQALHELSRDHHVALSVALALRRADEASAEAARDAFLAFWNERGREHFRAEEEVLLPRFVRVAGADHPVVARVLRDHASIRIAALNLEAAPAPDESLRSVGKLLAAHVRLEERGLLIEVENALDDAELARLADDLARFEAPATG